MGTKFSVDPEDARACVPKGEYVVMVEKIEEKKAKSKPGDTKEKYPYLEVTMKVVGGQFENWPITDRLSLSPDAKFRIAGFVKACGLAQGSGEQEFDTDNFLGAILCLKGDVEESAAFGDSFRPARYWMHPDRAKELGLEPTKSPEESGAAVEPTAEAAATTEPAAAPAAPAATTPAKGAPAATPATKKLPPPPPRKSVKV